MALKEIHRAVSFLEDQHFQDMIIAMLVYDRDFCKTAAHLLSPLDFKAPEKDVGKEREHLAELALHFYHHYRQPLGRMLKVEVQEFIRRTKMEEHMRARLLNYVDTFSPQMVQTMSPDAILSKVQTYKTEMELVNAMTTMQDALGAGELTMDEFLRIARKAAEKVHDNGQRPTNIFSDKQLEMRMARRELQATHVRYPALLIDPIDRMIRIIARKHLGLILAPYKRGKTMLFVWLALAYVLQNMNVLHFTLEDPKDDIEDRFDAAITNLPLSRLTENPDRVRRKFQHFKKYARTKLKVVDGTDGDMTMAKIEAIYEQEHNRGFTADVVLVDYDDEIRPLKEQKERRMEFADIYRDYRAFLARHELIGWTASQTSRKSDDMKIISGKYVAEDISKIRKASFALSLGQGEWGDDSIFLWVAAHRYDRMNVGANILTNKEKSLFYDREATLAREKLELEKKIQTP